MTHSGPRLVHSFHHRGRPPALQKAMPQSRGKKELGLGLQLGGQCDWCVQDCLENFLPAGWAQWRVEVGGGIRVQPSP